MMVEVYFCLCGGWFLETAYFKKLLKCFVCNLKSVYHEAIKTSFIIAFIKSSLKVRSCYLIQWRQGEHYVAEQATLGSKSSPLMGQIGVRALEKTFFHVYCPVSSSLCYLSWAAAYTKSSEFNDEVSIWAVLDSNHWRGIQWLKWASSMQNAVIYICPQFYFNTFHVFANYRQQIPSLCQKLLRKFWLQVPFPYNSSVCCVEETTVHMFWDVNSVHSMWKIVQFCREHFMWIQPNETYAFYYIKYIFYNNPFNIMKMFSCLLYNLYPSSNITSLNS